VGLNRDRPVLALNPRAQLKALLEQRMPLYRQVADVTVDTNGRTPVQVVQDLVDELEKRPRHA
jgi:shikimate kinase